MTEALIGAAIVAGLAMAIVAANQLAGKSIKTLHQGSASQTLSDRLKALLETPGVCSANFASATAPVSFNTLSLPSEVVPVSQIIISAGATERVTEVNAISEEGMKVSSIELSGFQELEAQRAYTAQLIVQQVKTGSNQSFGSTIRKIRIPILMETTVSGSTATVKRCSASGLPDIGDGMAIALKFCDSVGGTWDAANRACQRPLPPPDQVCVSLGGTWSGGVCTPNVAGTCTSFGSQWSWRPPCTYP